MIKFVLLLLYSGFPITYSIGFHLRSKQSNYSPPEPLFGLNAHGKNNRQRINENILQMISVNKYSIALDVKPLRTKSASSAMGFMLAEVISQAVLLKGKFYIPKIVAMASYGAFIHGPFGHMFYNKLNKAIPDATVSSVTKKIVIDQLLYVPFLSALMVLYFGGFILKLPIDSLIVLGRTVIPPLVSFSWIVWPISHFINFSIIPARFRLLFINLVQLLNNIYISKLLTPFFK